MDGGEGVNVWSTKKLILDASLITITDRYLVKLINNNFRTSKGMYVKLDNFKIMICTYNKMPNDD